MAPPLGPPPATTRRRQVSTGTAAVAVPPRTPRPEWPRWLIVACGWLVALGFVILAASNYARIADAADRFEQARRQAPGNAAGRGACAALARTQPPVMYDPDGFCWISLTQQQARDGTWREHHFSFDNTPSGLDRQWSSSLSWWLRLTGSAARLVTGEPLDAAIARAAAWANPLLFALFLAGLAPVLRQRLDPWATAMFLVTLASLWGVEWDFSYGRPDHHGLHLMAFLGLVLGALLGGLGWVRDGGAAGGGDGFLVQPGTFRQARAWFTLSGVCGGTGLWIGSTQQVVGIAALGAGAALGVLLASGRGAGTGGSRFAPELWRHWARVGAATSVGFYLLEYFPSHLQMRLEVNHPLTALGWLGAGEVLWALLLARTDGPQARRRGREVLAAVALGALGMSLPVLALLCGPKDWWWLGDPVTRRSIGLISEGKSWLGGLSAAQAGQQVWKYTGLLALGLPLAGWALWRSSRQREVLPPWRQAALATGMTLTLVFLGWTLLQNRWMGFLETSAAVLALLVASCLPPRRAAATGWPRVILLALTLPGWLAYGATQWRMHLEDPTPRARALLGTVEALKEAAWNLQLAAGQDAAVHQPPRVMSTLGQAPALHYYGGVDTVGSYYWENVSGSHAAVDFYRDGGDDAVARRIARERGLDFVVALADPTFVLELQWLALGRTDLPAARRTLAYRLANPNEGQVPGWLEELPLRDAPLARSRGLRIFRVVKAQL